MLAVDLHSHGFSLGQGWAQKLLFNIDLLANQQQNFANISLVSDCPVIPNHVQLRTMHVCTGSHQHLHIVHVLVWVYMGLSIASELEGECLGGCGGVVVAQCSEHWLQLKPGALALIPSSCPDIFSSSKLSDVDGVMSSACGALVHSLAAITTEICMPVGFLALSTSLNLTLMYP